MPISGKIWSVEALRAVAALCVVLIHANPKFAIGQIGVDLFFVISGFVIVFSSEHLFSSADGSSTFVLRRLIRIVPMYWLTTAVFALNVFLFHPEIPFQAYLCSFLFIPYVNPNGTVAPLNGVGWSLNYEMVFYALFAPCVGLSRNRAVAACSSLLIVCVLAAVIVPMPMPLQYWFEPIVLEFVVGMFIALAYRSGIMMPLWLRGSVVAASLLWIAVSNTSDLSLRVIQWGMPCSLILASAVLGKRIIPKEAISQAFAALGSASYILYLTHPIVFATAPYLSRWAGFAFIDNAIVLFVSAVLFAIMAHAYLEKPLTIYLQTLPRHRRESRATATSV